jgi:hypothetical protein
VPTVLRLEGFAFRVYLDDHPPAHVHGWKGEGWVSIRLPEKGENARPIRSVRMKDADVSRAVHLVETNAEILWNGWRRYHDPTTGR